MGNTNSPWDFVREDIGSAYDQFLPTPWFIGEYGASQQPEAIIRNDLMDMGPQAKQRSQVMISPSVWSSARSVCWALTALPCVVLWTSRISSWWSSQRQKWRSPRAAVSCRCPWCQPCLRSLRAQARVCASHCTSSPRHARPHRHLSRRMRLLERQRCSLNDGGWALILNVNSKSKMCTVVFCRAEASTLSRSLVPSDRDGSCLQRGFALSHKYARLPAASASSFSSACLV